MNLHTDVPSRGQIDLLLEGRDPASVSIYLPTDPTSNADAERIELRNLASEAVHQLEEAGTPKSHGAAIADEIAGLDADGGFWRYQARSLALFATPGSPGQLAAVRELYDRRASQGRTAQDVVDLARAATYGAVDTVIVDIDDVVPGSVDEESGAVAFAEQDDAVAYGVVDEIARRVWMNGGRVLAVRREDVPGGGQAAAILRYAV